MTLHTSLFRAVQSAESAPSAFQDFLPITSRFMGLDSRFKVNHVGDSL